MEGKTPTANNQIQIMKTYNKIRFSSKRGPTAGLIIETEKLDKMTITEISRLFPLWESGNMTRFERSPNFETWNDAFFFGF